jgi:hypothetical protein
LLPKVRGRLRQPYEKRQFCRRSQIESFRWKAIIFLLGVNRPASG